MRLKLDRAARARSSARYCTTVNFADGESAWPETRSRMRIVNSYSPGASCRVSIKPGQRQTLTGVAHAAPVFRLFAKLLAIFHQRILDVDRRTQRGLINAGIVNLQVNSDRLAPTIDSGNVWNHFLSAR